MADGINGEVDKPLDRTPRYSVKGVAGRWGCSKSTVRRLQDAGQLAPPQRISERVVRWSEADLVAYESW